MATREELEAQIAALEQALEDLPRGWKNQRERRIRSEQREEARRQIGVIQSQLDKIVQAGRTVRDPSARMIATPSGPPGEAVDYEGMTFDELHTVLRSPTTRDIRIEARQVLIKKIDSELKRLNAIVPADAAEGERNRNQITELTNLKEGKRRAGEIKFKDVLAGIPTIPLGQRDVPSLEEQQESDKTDQREIRDRVPSDQRLDAALRVAAAFNPALEDITVATLPFASSEVRAEVEVLQKMVEATVQGKEFVAPDDAPTWITDLVKDPNRVKNITSAVSQANKGPAPEPAVTQLDEATGEYIPVGEVTPWTPEGVPPGGVTPPPPTAEQVAEGAPTTGQPGVTPGAPSVPGAPGVPTTVQPGQAPPVQQPG